MFDLVIQLAINGILLGGIYALVSIGLTLIFGIVDVVNFAHGDFLMLSMFGCFWLWHFFGLSPYVSIIIVCFVFFFLGMFVQKVLIWPMRNSSMLNLIFTTLGLSLIIANGALLLWKADSRAINMPELSKTQNIGGFLFSMPRAIAFLTAIAFVIGLLMFLKRTRTGRAIRALAQDRRAAMLVGINVSVLYQVAFGIGLVTTAAAGALLLPVFNVSPSTGQIFSTICFVIVVMGGFGYLEGSLIAGLLIGLVESFSGYFLSIHLKEAVYFIIFVLVLWIKPTGIMGGKER